MIMNTLVKFNLILQIGLTGRITEFDQKHFNIFEIWNILDVRFMYIAYIKLYMDDKKAIVVGGGFGGLSSACCLQKIGFDVTLLEKNNQVGGVASRLEKNGFKFDMGPSWYMMHEVFEKFFGKFDRDPEDFYELEEINPQYKVLWKDGDSVNIPNNIDDMKQIFKSYENGADKELEKYMSESKRAYEVGMKRFIYPNRSSITDFVDFDVMKSIKAGLLFKDSMEEHISDYFTNEKLRQILLYNTMFLGGSPKNTPALYKLMNYATMNGVYYPKGGINNVVKSFKKLGEDLGVNYKIGEEVNKIEKRNDGELRTITENQSFNSDIIVSNADYQFTEQELLDKKYRDYDKEYWDDINYSPSAMILYLGINKKLDSLNHHTLIFPEDWDSYFKTIENKTGLPDDPAYYLNIPSLTDPKVAPDGKESVMVLVPVASDIEVSDKKMDNFRDDIIQDIESSTDIDIFSSIEAEERMFLDDFKERYNKSASSALGVSHTAKQTSILRPNMKSSSLKGLYHVGADTRPGIGTSMCTLSGMHLSEMIKNDYPN